MGALFVVGLCNSDNNFSVLSGGKILKNSCFPGTKIPNRRPCRACCLLSHGLLLLVFLQIVFFRELCRMLFGSIVGVRLRVQPVFEVSKAAAMSVNHIDQQFPHG